MVKLRVGISACLLGHLVRYDGGHQKDDFLVAKLSESFELVALCPEYETGFGVPREPMQLVGPSASPRLRTIDSHRDLTDPLSKWSRHRAQELVDGGMCGVVLKSRSPSCGVASVSVVGHDGAVQSGGSGLFVLAMMARFPGLPLMESDALQARGSLPAFVAAVQQYAARQ